MLEPADQCARVEGDTVVFAADVLGRMDFNEDGLSPVFAHGSWRWVASSRGVRLDATFSV